MNSHSNAVFHCSGLRGIFGWKILICPCPSRPANPLVSIYIGQLSGSSFLAFLVSKTPNSTARSSDKLPNLTLKNSVRSNKYNSQWSQHSMSLMGRRSRPSWKKKYRLPGPAHRLAINHISGRTDPRRIPS